MKDKSRQSEEPSQRDEFARLSEQPGPGLLQEIAGLILHNKKWWLVPLILALMLVGAIIFLGSTPAAPFIYTLF